MRGNRLIWKLGVAVLAVVAAYLYGGSVRVFGVELGFPDKSSTSEEIPVSSSVPASASSTTSLSGATVARVIDGDTIVVLQGGASSTVRLIGVDTPEVVDTRKPVQCFGKEASDFTKMQLATGTPVRLEADASQGTLDKYGRTLAYVYLGDGTLLNKTLIAEGYGHEYTYRTPYEKQSEFKAAEAAAREAKKGLWADGACAGK